MSRPSARARAANLALLGPCVIAILTCSSTAAAQAAEPADVRSAEAASAEPNPTRDAVAQSEARAQFRRGVALIQEQRLPEAVEAFRASADLVPRASTLYNLALSLLRLGRYRECLDVAGELESQLDAGESEVREGVQTAGMRTRAQILRQRATDQLARLVLLVEPADAQLSVDGEQVTAIGGIRALLLDPGLHRVRLERDGFAAVTHHLRLRAGQAVRKTIMLEPLRPQLVHKPSATAAESEPPVASTRGQPDRTRGQPSRLVSSLLFVGGGVLLGAGAVTGILAKQKDDSVRASCGGTFDNCSPLVMGDAEDVGRLALATDLLLVAGAALGIAGGITWFMLEASDDAVQVGLTPGGAELRGRF